MSNISVDGSRNNIRGDTNNIRIKLSIGSIIVIGIGIISFFLFFSSKNIDEEIIGTWQNEEYTELYITFLNENSVSITDNSGILNGTYIFTGDDSIKINVNAFIFEYAITADVSIKGNTLSFKNVNDSYGSGTWLGGESTTSFKRIK